MKISKCRWCKYNLSLIISLGELPIVNYFPSREELGKEKKYPLNLCICNNCSLVQLDYIIPSSKLFTRYHFLSGCSLPLIVHLERLADICVVEFGLKEKSKVLDIGANDGTFLANFKKRNMVVLGVEPAAGICQTARKKGIPIIQGFFDERLAAEIKDRAGDFDLITANRVLANIVNLKSFLLGVKLLLAENGVFVVETASLETMLNHGYYDSIYHEHYSYFSLAVLKKIFWSAGLTIFRAERNSFQEGSLRVFAHHRRQNDRRPQFTEEIGEKDYRNFSQKVAAHKALMTAFFKKHQDKTTIGYGAPAKGVTLLNYCGLTKENIAYIVDSTPAKQGRLMPGVHIPIYPEEYLQGKKMDYILLIAWNYQPEIRKKIVSMTGKDIKIIIPFPKPSIFEI